MDKQSATILNDDQKAIDSGMLKNALRSEDKHLDVNRTTDIADNKLELLAERPKVDIERYPLGNVRLSKQVKSQTINVPVTLTQEYLVIEHTPNARNIDNEKDLVMVEHDESKPLTTILVNGERIDLTHGNHEILLSQQVARVAIETLVAEKVELSTTTTTHEQQIPVTLRHEELVAEEVKVDNPTVLSTTTVMDADVKVR